MNAQENFRVRFGLTALLIAVGAIVGILGVIDDSPGTIGIGFAVMVLGLLPNWVRPKGSEQ